MADHGPLVDDPARDYDALLVVSFGGPEGPDDVMPFLDNVFRGIPVGPDTKARIAERYARFGGVSPINAHTRAFIAALQHELASNGPRLPIYWGNRNWHPLLPDTLARMSRDGVRRALVYVTSTFSSYSGCRKYREDLFEAMRPLERPFHLDKLRVGFNHPGFVTAMAERTREALEHISAERRSAATVLFSAHSLPLAMAARAAYEAQLLEASRLVSEALGHTGWRLVYQSNNARYGDPWLEPDVSDALAEAAEQGARDVVVAPIGFVCDHLEVVLDLDIEAAEAARALGIDLVRAGTVGTHPAYVSMVRELIVERMSANPERRALGRLGPSHDVCPADCCLPGRPGPAKPALCGTHSPVTGADDAVTR